MVFLHSLMCRLPSVAAPSYVNNHFHPIHRTPYMQLLKSTLKRFKATSSASNERARSNVALLHAAKNARGNNAILLPKADQCVETDVKTQCWFATTHAKQGLFVMFVPVFTVCMHIYIYIYVYVYVYPSFRASIVQWMPQSVCASNLALGKKVRSTSLNRMVKCACLIDNNITLKTR